MAKDEAMIRLRNKIALHHKLWSICCEIESEFEDDELQRTCKHCRVWTDPFDGEEIPKCYLTRKGKKMEDRMECTLMNCPFHAELVTEEAARKTV